MKDLTIDFPAGLHQEVRTVGYYPRDHPRFPGALDTWSILCTVPGAIGPIHQHRIVERGPWISKEKP